MRLIKLLDGLVVYLAVVLRRVKIGVLLCCFLSRELLRGRWYFFGRSSFLFGSRLCFHSIRTVKAGTIVIHLFVHHVFIDVGVVNDGLVHICHSRVVTETISLPAAAPITVAGVAMAVVNAAVKSDSRAPISFVKDVGVIIPAPPRGGPKHTDRWRSNPLARRP